MALHMNTSYNTNTLRTAPGVSLITAHPSSSTDLRPGDFLNVVNGPNGEHHAVLFDHWESDHVRFSVFSFGGGSDGSAPPERETNRTFTGTIGGHPASVYSAYRYSNVIPDMPGSGATAVEGALYREPNGTIAVIAGGAPVSFSNPAELVASGYGGAPMTAVPEGWLNSLPQDPRNGTFLRNAGDGSIYVIAGRAKYGLNPEEYAVLGSPSSTNVPVRYLDLFGTMPADGSYLRNPADGSIYVIAGGAKYGLTMAQYLALGSPSSTNVPAGFINSLGNTPQPGTVQRNHADGAIYVTVGGAKYHLNPAEYAALGSPASTNVPIEWIDSLSTVPADGSYLRGPDTTIYSIVGGKKKPLSFDEWTQLGRPGAVNVPAGFLNLIPNA
jgi:hypothetical protein